METQKPNKALLKFNIKNEFFEEPKSNSNRHSAPLETFFEFTSRRQQLCMK